MRGEKRKPGFKESARILLRALKVSIKIKTKASLLIGILGFPMAFVPTLISLSLREFSNIIQELFGAGVEAESLYKAAGAFVILSALYIIQLVYRSLRNYYTKNDSLRTREYIKEHILRCSCNVKYKYIENYDDFKDKVRFADTDAGLRVAESMQSIIVWLQDIVTFVSVAAVLLKVSVWIVAILLATCIPSVILAYMQKDEEYIKKVKWTREFGMTISYFFEATWQHSMNEVRFLGLFDYLKSKWRAMKNKQIRVKNKMSSKHVLFNSVSDIFRNSVYIVILLITASKIFARPSLGIGTFMLVITMAGALQDATANIFIRFTQFFGDIAYMKAFFDLDNLEYENRSAQSGPMERFDILFDNVSFTYPNTDREVLHNITVHIGEGEKVAVVGENGSGKTTFVNLLCALYEPDSGAITIGGHDIYKDVSKTHQTISAVFQDFGRYEGTIRQNICISDRGKRVDEERLQEICKKTGAWAFIETQDKRLDEIVGLFNEGGNNLSGGQWQKIAITRCAYRDKARIMILDEPTAALDPVAEADLYRNFSQLTGDRTTILVSHRLGITNLVDRILVFDDGFIVEEGDHKSLMALGGLYAKMYAAQAQWYK